MKLCEKCYRRIKRRKDAAYRGPLCSVCARWVLRRERLEKKRAYNAKKQKAQKCTLRTRFANGKAQAKSRGLVWALSFEKYIDVATRPCHYCGASTEGSGSGLDRIDCARDYTNDNVLPCCGPCNRTRSNLYSVAEMEVMIRALLDFRRIAT